MGVAETEEALRAEVSEVCRYYCLQVWNEVLNQVGVEASSTLKRAESVYYPPIIRASGSSGSKADTASKEANAGKESPTKVLPSLNSPSKEAEWLEVAEKEANITKEVTQDAGQPLATPKDPSKEKVASHNMEIVLTTLLIPTKEDLKGKDPASSTAASIQLAKPLAKDKFVIKIKPWDLLSFFLLFFFWTVVFVSKICNQFALL